MSARADAVAALRDRAVAKRAAGKAGEASELDDAADKLDRVSDVAFMNAVVAPPEQSKLKAKAKRRPVVSRAAEPGVDLLDRSGGDVGVGWWVAGGVAVLAGGLLLSRRRA